jgi:hypothetical protein
MQAEEKYVVLFLMFAKHMFICSRHHMMPSAHLSSQPNATEKSFAPSKKEDASPNVSIGTAEDEVEDDERIEHIVLGPSPAQVAAEQEALSSKKKGKRPVRGKN